VVNLLTNAAKFTLTVDTSRSSSSRKGAKPVLRVRDTGVGIAPELLPRIFDLFTQAEGSLDRSQGGWVSDYAWFNGSWNCTEGEWRLIVRWETQRVCRAFCQ